MKPARTSSTSVIFIIVLCLTGSYGLTPPASGTATERFHAADESGYIEGFVYDAETGEPLAAANVMVAHTMLGAATNADGYFRIEPVPAGSYELSASMLGYATRTLDVDVTAEGPARLLEIRIESRAYELGELDVAYDRPRSWRRHLNVFHELLLGDSPNAENSVILNPEVLDFEDDGAFEAKAAAPLRIENRALGYLITFELDELYWDRSAGIMRYSGRPYFQEMTPENPEEEDRWQENRETTYRGSLHHLLWSLTHQRSRQEGFMMFHDDRFNAPYSHVIPRLQLLSDRHVLEPAERRDQYTLDFDDYLQVTYLEDSRTNDLSFRRARSASEEITWLAPNNPAGTFDESGFLSSPSPVVVYGDMSSKRLADQLPREDLMEIQERHTDRLLAEAARTDELAAPFSERTYELRLMEDHLLADAFDGSEVPQRFLDLDWQRLAADLSRQLRDDPDDLELRFKHAIVQREISRVFSLFNIGSSRTSREDFEYILEYDSLYQDIFFQLAQLEASLGNFGVAAELAHRQLELKPHLEDTHIGLFRIYRKYSYEYQNRRTLDWLERDGSDYARILAADLRRRLGEPEMAVDALQDLLDGELTIPRQPVLLALARAYFANGDKENGQSSVAEAVESIESRLDARFVFEDFKYVVSTNELDTYRSLNSAADYIRFYSGMWASRDPMPARPVNTRLASHYERLIEAEDKYVYVGVRSWHNNPDILSELNLPTAYYLNDLFNDKGLVFIRHGEPDQRVATVAGEINTFRSSIGQGLVQPRERSFLAGWVPNESWRYSNPQMDFHFVIAEGAGADNWRLTPTISNIDMLLDREIWGGLYARLGSIARRVREDQDETSRHSMQEFALNDPTDAEQGTASFGEPPSAGQLESFAPGRFDELDFSQFTSELASESRNHVEAGLTSDGYRWTRDVRPMDVPMIAAAFRGQDNETTLEFHFAMPTGYIASHLPRDVTEIDVEVGVAIHDSLWQPVASHVEEIPVEASTAESIASVNRMDVQVKPGPYNLSFHSLPEQTRLQTAYRFERNVPDFSSSGLQMSDVLPAFRIDPAVAPEAMSRDEFNIVANPTGRFDLDQPVHLYFEIYNLAFDGNGHSNFTVNYTLAENPEARGVMTRLFRRSDETVLTLSTERTGSNVTSFEFGEIDVSRVPPGLYSLTVAVTDNITGDSASRTIPVRLTE